MLFVDWMSVPVFPFGMHRVDEVECPNEVGLRCTAPNCNGVVFMCDFIDAWVAFFDSGGGGEEAVGRT